MIFNAGAAAFAPLAAAFSGFTQPPRKCLNLLKLREACRHSYCIIRSIEHSARWNRWAAFSAGISALFFGLGNRVESFFNGTLC